MDGSIQALGDMAVTQGTTPAALAGRVRGGNVDQAAQDFEAMFVSQMLQPMFEGIGADPMFGGGHAEEIMRTFLIQEYGKIAAKSGRLGIAAEVKNEMIRAQEQASSPAPLHGGPYASAQ